MTSASVTRRELSLGAIDTVTGWYAKSFTNSTIQASIQNKGASFSFAGFGYKAIYDKTGFIPDVIADGDEIIDANGTYYLVKTAQDEWYFDKFSHYTCELVEKLTSADRPATFGTASATVDPRTTIKSLLDTNLSASALTKDNGTTSVSKIVCWSNPDYPITKILLPTEKNIDLIYALSPVTVSPVNSNGVVIGYTQALTITIYTIDKSGITAQNLLWKAEAELRHVIETHGLGSVRVTVTQSKEPNVPTIYSQEYSVVMPVELDVTLRTLTLGVADSITGLYAKSYATSTIQMSFMPKGSNVIQSSVGSYTKHDVTGVTSDVVLEGDMILHGGTYYEVTATVVHPVLSLTGNTSPFNYYFCYLTKVPLHTDRPATSGTWHLDSESLRTDPRYRHKNYLDSYLTAVNLKEDNGTTNATYITCFDGADYPITKVFLTKAVDLVFSVKAKEVSDKPELKHAIGKCNFAFEEFVEITASAVNKAGITAINLVEQAEQEIRHILTDHPLGSKREISSIKHDPVDLGETMLYSTTVTIRYTRVNDDYVPSVPTISYGEGFIYECDRLLGGPEGTWTETEDGNTGTFTILPGNDYLDLNISASAGNKVYYVQNGTHLGLSSNIYTRARIRYYTAGPSAKVDLVFSDATTQTLMALINAPTFDVEDVAITAGKTIDHIRLYANDATGHVYYDFIEIYKGTYVLPNCIDLKPPKLTLQDANLMPFGSVGSRTQGGGAQDAEIVMTCDLDMEPALLTWKRPQVATPKTDHTNMDILYESHQENATTKLWHWLDYGDGQIKARLIDVSPDYGSEGHKVILTFREYCHGSKAGETYTQRFGLDL